MDDFAKMDIFFLVTTVAVVALAVLVGVLIFYILRTARDVSDVVRIVKKESERFAEGVSTARREMTGRGESIAQKFIAFVQSLASVRKSKKSK